MSMFVCLSVCLSASISPELHVQSPPFCACDISATVRPISKKFNVITQNMSLEWLAVKMSISKFQDSRHLESRQIAIYHRYTERVSEAYICRPSSWISKMKFLMGGALETQVRHRCAKFCGDRSYCCRDIAIFRVFQVKSKNSVVLQIVPSSMLPLSLESTSDFPPSTRH